MPDQVFSRHFRAEVVDLGAHVAVGQLEPSARVGVGKFIGVVQEVARDLLVVRVHAQRQVGRGHHGRVLFAWVMSIDHHVFGRAVFGVPLNGACGGRHLNVFILEQHFEVTHVPSGRVGFPSAIKAAGGGVAALAGAVLVDPAKTHFVHGRAFGLGADQGRVACAVHLAKSVATGDQGHGFIVVHGHAGEGLTHIVGRQLGVWVAVRALWVHVNQTHLYGGQGVVQLTLAAVAAVVFVAGGQPLCFSAPEDVFFGCPDVRSAAAKAKGFEAHGLHGHVTAQNEQVGPRNFVAVFFLDGPQQAATFVEVAIVWKAVEGCKALIAGAGTAAAVGCAVGAGGVPS